MYDILNKVISIYSMLDNVQVLFIWIWKILSENMYLPNFSTMGGMRHKVIL